MLEGKKGGRSCLCWSWGDPHGTEDALLCPAEGVSSHPYSSNKQTSKQLEPPVNFHCASGETQGRGAVLRLPTPPVPPAPPRHPATLAPRGPSDTCSPFWLRAFMLLFSPPRMGVLQLFPRRAPWHRPNFLVESVLVAVFHLLPACVFCLFPS